MNKEDTVIDYMVEMQLNCRYIFNSAILREIQKLYAIWCARGTIWQKAELPVSPEEEYRANKEEKETRKNVFFLFPQDE